MGEGRPPLPFPDSLCHLCRLSRMVRTARSGFILCQAPGLPRYARQPVRGCPGFSARDGDSGTE